MPVIDFAADRRQFLVGMAVAAAVPLGAGGLAATGLSMPPAEPDHASAAQRSTLTGLEMIDVGPDGT